MVKSNHCSRMFNICFQFLIGRAGERKGIDDLNNRISKLDLINLDIFKVIVKVVIHVLGVGFTRAYYSIENKETNKKQIKNKLR